MTFEAVVVVVLLLLLLLLPLRVSPVAWLRSPRRRARHHLETRDLEGMKRENNGIKTGFKRD